MFRDPENMDVAGGVFDDEEHVDPLEERGVHREEVAGQYAGGLRGQERAPGGVGPAGRGVNTGAATGSGEPTTSQAPVWSTAHARHS